MVWNRSTPYDALPQQPTLLKTCCNKSILCECFKVIEHKFHIKSSLREIDGTEMVRLMVRKTVPFGALFWCIPWPARKYVSEKTYSTL